MTTTLTRPETRQPTVVPAPNRFPITLLVAAIVLATAFLVAQVLATPAVDGSHDVAEFSRQTALAPFDDSHISAEYARMTALAVVTATDGSHQDAETARMMRQAPIVDNSFEGNEAARQGALGG